MRKASYILSVVDMYVKAAARKAVTAARALLIIAACAAMIIFSESCKNGVIKGLELCLRVLVPSLFPFMALAGITVKSGLCHRLGRRLTGITRRLFGLSGAFAPIILLSLIGGYPVGARGIAQLRSSKAASEHEAKKAALFTVCAGPGFLINYVGASIYYNETVGLIMLLAQIISVLLLGIIINLFDKKKKQHISDKEINCPSLPLSTVLVEAVFDAAKGILGICSLVLLFSAITEICGQLVKNEAVINTATALLEVCGAVVELSSDCPIEIVAFAIGFGGLCVHFQIFSALGDIKVNKPLFFFMRIIQGIITALLTKSGTMLFLRETAVFSTGTVASAGVFGGSVLSAAALLTVSVCFLFTLKRK